MTRIGQHGGGAAGQDLSGFAGEAGAFDLRRGASARREGGRDPDLDGGGPFGTRADAAAPSREAAFQASVREALARDEPGLDPSGPEGERVLAIAEWRAGAPFPFQVAAPAPAGDPSALPAREPVAEALAVRVEQALRAEALAALHGPVALRLDLGGAVEGLHALTVTMTATSLDVTLVRAEGAVPEELIRSAQALADRLQLRFAKRVVRVLDRVEGGGADGSGPDGEAGLAAISRLLGGAATDA